MKKAAQNVLDNTIDFFEGLSPVVVIPDIIEERLSSSNIVNYQAAKGLFFGAVNRALRKYCISQQKNLIMMKRYSLMHALIGFWWSFENKLYDYAMQTGLIFEEVTKLELNQRSGVILNETYFQIVRLGFQNWADYILNFKFVSDEFLTMLKLIEEAPALYPYQDNTFIPKLINYLGLIKKTPEAAEEDLSLIIFISASLRLFIQHKNMYPEAVTEDLQYCSMLVDSMPVHIMYSRKFDEVRDKSIKILESIEKKVDVVNRSPANFTVFDSVEYQELLKMIYSCNPEIYMKEYVPLQLKQISNVFQSKRIDPKTTSPRVVFDFLHNTIYPIYKMLDDIMQNNMDHRRKFAALFAERFMPIKLFADFRGFFIQNDEKLITSIWNMSKFLTDYVAIISDAFYSYFKRTIDKYVLQKHEDDLNEEVLRINNYVDNVFGHDQLMVLTRSSIYMPHQSDQQLLGRARGLIEMAHEPKKMNVSIRELFDIVPHVKDKQDLFTSIAKFIQNQLLSKIDPNIELEQSLINSMGQYADYEYIQPIKQIVNDFAHRFDFWNEVKQKISDSSDVKIMVLPSTTWTKIMKNDRLKVFNEFDSLKAAFLKEFKRKNPKKSLIFMDPNSLVEARGRLKGMDRELKFLFNGTQFAIVKFLEGKSYANSDQLKSVAISEDTQEQIDNLVNSGLLEYSNGYYKLADNIPSSMHRNYAIKYTSAENMAMALLKMQDIEKSVSACIIRILKTGKKLNASEIVVEVKKRTAQYFRVDDDTIREQIRDAEIKEFIRMGQESGKYSYLP